jgi:uncharacterized protein YmfQ (DUF2313 family)
MDWGGGDAKAHKIYNGMVTSRGEGRYSTDPDAAVNVELKAAAWAIEAAGDAIERAQLQFWPPTSTDFLPDWERVLGRIPAPDETIGERQEALRIILANQRPNDMATVLETLQELVGPQVTQVIANGWTVSVFADPSNAADVEKIHAILSPWLAASTTIEVIESTPFLLGVSRLSRGAF